MTAALPAEPAAEGTRPERASGEPPAPFTLVHLSDPHIGPLPRPRLSNLASKRVIGYVNWRQNRGRTYQPAILAGLVESVGAVGADHIAVTGDLVNIALRREMEVARDWLDRLGTPADVTVVPGNHDAYVPGALKDVRRLWGPFMTGDDRSDGKIFFPFVRRRGPVALVGTSSARATMPFMATGHMSDRQIASMGEMLDRLGREGLFRVVMVHHPPAPPAPDWNRRLVGSRRFRQAILENGAELVLHGHDHVGSVVMIDGRDGKVPVVGVPSASNAPGGRHPAAAFNIYRISGTPGCFSCHMTEFGFTDPGAPMRLIAETQLTGTPEAAQAGNVTQA